MPANRNEVRLSDTVTLLRPDLADSARVYLVAVGGRLAIVACVACVNVRIAGAGTQRHGWKP